MKTTPINSLVLAGSLLTGACGMGSDGPRAIDGSSQDTYESTMAAARRDLGPQDRVKFEAALTEFKAQMFAKAENRLDYNRLVREGMDGLTGPAIVAEFDRNTEKLGNDAADAIFDAKRALKAGG